MGKPRRRSFARKKEDHNDLFHRAGKLFVSSDRFFCRKKCREKFSFCSGLLLYIFPLYAHRKGFIQNHQQDRFLQTGKISYSIYVMQEAAFYILSHTLWKNAGFLKRCPAAALGLSVVLTILFGAGIYYLVERPMQTAGKINFSCCL